MHRLVEVLSKVVTFGGVGDKPMKCSARTAWFKASIHSQMAGTPARTYPAGTTWFEPSSALHMFAENPSPTEMAELLAVFVSDEDRGPLVIPEPS